MTVATDSPKSGKKWKSFLAVGAVAIAGLAAFVGHNLNNSSPELAAQAVSPAASAVSIAASAPILDTNALFALDSSSEKNNNTVLAQTPVPEVSKSVVAKAETVKKVVKTKKLTGQHTANIKLTSTASLTQPELTATIDSQSLSTSTTTIADAFLGQPAEVTVGKTIQLEGKYVKLMSDGTKEVWQNDSVNGDSHLATVHADGKVNQHKDGVLNKLSVKQALSDPLLDTAIQFADFNPTGDREADLSAMQSRHGQDIWEKKAWHPVRMASKLDNNIDPNDFSEENTLKSQRIVSNHQLNQLGTAISDAGSSIAGVFKKPASFWVDHQDAQNVVVEDRSTYSPAALAAKNDIRTDALSANPVIAKIDSGLTGNVTNTATTIQSASLLTTSPDIKSTMSPDAAKVKAALLETGSDIPVSSTAVQATGHQKSANLQFTSSQTESGEIVVKKGDNLVGFLDNGKVYNAQHKIASKSERSAVLDGFKNSQQTDANTATVDTSKMSEKIKESSFNFGSLMEQVRMNSQIGVTATLNSPKPQ